MCRPYLSIAQLPDFPNADRSTMRVIREAKRPLESAISYDLRPAVHGTWRPRRIDVLALKQTTRYRSDVREVLCGGGPEISKIACSEWDVRKMEMDTWACSIISWRQQQHLGGCLSAPDVLGYLMENGRGVGLLLEEVDGEFASGDDMPKCEMALRGLHGMGLVHGDVNRYNFIVNRSTAHVRTIGFEHAEAFDATKAHSELGSLASELAEEI
jgi:hypothetical protein